MKKISGFTLVELIIAIAVIGIISSISLPIYKNLLPTINLSSSSRDLASDLRFAQQMAVTEQIIYSVSFDKINNKYSVIKTSDGTVKTTKTLNREISFQAISGFDDDKVEFVATGASVQNGTITLINRQNKTSIIEIKPSGYVKIQ
ncbi:MAG: GspH/FimT family pseudopilin [Candidatus Buchananbacteria bacterium]